MILKVKVFPGSGKEKVTEKKEGFEVRVKEKPQEGRANEAVLKALSSFLKIPQERMRIIKGFRKRNKVIKINEL